MTTWRACAAAFALVLSTAALLAGAPQAGAKTVWLCKPGEKHNPCEPRLDTSMISPTGEVLGTKTPKADKKPKIDCFYVYPTVSDDQTRNSDRSIDPEERSIALYQAARYSQYCRVYAPVYRQFTIPALLSGQPTTAEEQALAYGDVLSAWKTYLKKFNDGRGVVLIGHSQGTLWLRKLISEQIDSKKSVRKQIVSAILLGGNVLVAKGQDSGGDFDHIPACYQPTDTGCVIAYSTFNAPVPAGSLFGRPGGTTFGGDPANEQVLCTNPAALTGGSGVVHAIMPTEPFAPGTTIGAATQAVGFPRSNATTTWVEADSAYTAACSSADNANVLQLTDLPGAPHLNAVPDATWGLHLVDANIALGNLIDTVHKQERAYLAG
jgi:hypothetical protein